MGYTDNEAMVRVDRFKPSGKWYDSFALNMGQHYKAPLLRDAVVSQLQSQGYTLGYYTFVVLEPYHQFSHPIMIRGASPEPVTLEAQ